MLNLAKILPSVAPCPQAVDPMTTIADAHLSAFHNFDLWPYSFSYFGIYICLFVFHGLLINGLRRFPIGKNLNSIRSLINRAPRKKKSSVGNEPGAPRGKDHGK